MRKSSRRWRAIATAALAVLLAVVALALAACGDDGEASDGSGIPGIGDVEHDRRRRGELPLSAVLGVGE